jgi:2-dehydro-3-deoxygluconokinase
VIARPWPHADLIVGLGEAMLEMAPVDGGLYSLGFAGDTLNTCWYLKQLLGDSRRVGYVTRVGAGSLSRQLLDFLSVSGIRAVVLLISAEN